MNILHTANFDDVPPVLPAARIAELPAHLRLRVTEREDHDAVKGICHAREQTINANVKDDAARRDQYFVDNTVANRTSSPAAEEGNPHRGTINEPN